MSNKITASDLKKIVESSFERRKTEDESKKARHEEFIKRLKDTSDDFINMLTDEIEFYLKETANRGRKSIRFQSEFQFASTLGNVKISTLVYGWRTKDGWDATRYKEIGLKGTPFDYLVEEFKTRDIVIKNISNPNKGFGFWIEASFDI